MTATSLFNITAILICSVWGSLQFWFLSLVFLPCLHLAAKSEQSSQDGSYFKKKTIFKGSKAQQHSGKHKETKHQLPLGVGCYIILQSTDLHVDFELWYLFPRCNTLVRLGPHPLLFSKFLLPNLLFCLTLSIGLAILWSLDRRNCILSWFVEGSISLINSLECLARVDSFWIYN